MAAHLPSSGGAVGGGRVPPMIAEPFSRAMGESMWMPAVALAVMAVIALFFAPPNADADKVHGRTSEGAAAH